MKLIGSLLIACSCFAGGTYGVIELPHAACTSTPDAPKLLASIPALVGTTTISVPVCLSLGAGITVNLSSPTGPTLEITIPKPVTTPTPILTPHTESVPIPASTPATTTTISYTLLKPPAPNTFVLAALHSSQIGQDALVVAPLSLTTPQTIVLTLPLYRPFAGDYVTLVYWALE